MDNEIIIQQLKDMSKQLLDIADSLGGQDNAEPFDKGPKGKSIPLDMMVMPEDNKKDFKKGFKKQF